MNKVLRDILRSLPDKPPRSRLDPYRGFIEELVSQGRSYREIARILLEKCGVRVSISTLHDFVQLSPTSVQHVPKNRPVLNPRRSTITGAVDQTKVKDDTPMNKISRRSRSANDKSCRGNEDPEEFKFDPSQPLCLPSKQK